MNLVTMEWRCYAMSQLYESNLSMGTYKLGQQYPKVKVVWNENIYIVEHAF